MNKIQTLIEELKRENEVRANKIENLKTDWSNSALVHQYNLTLDFIKRLENLSF